MDKDPKLIKQQYPEYGVYVRREGGGYNLIVPELGIVRRHEDLNEGFKEISAAKVKFFEDLVASGGQVFHSKLEMLADLRAPASGVESLTPSLLSFTLRAAIIIFLFLGFGGIGAVVLGNAVSKNLSRATAVVGDKLAALPDEKVQGYAIKIHRIGIKLKPVIHEMKLLWATDENPAIPLKKPDE